MNNQNRFSLPALGSRLEFRVALEANVNDGDTNSSSKIDLILTAT